MRRTHYELLSVEPNATAAEIRRRYLVLARRHHPDAQGDASEAETDRARRRMQRINEAYAVLSDPGARRRYDESLRPPDPPRRPSAATPPAGPDPDDIDPVAEAGPVEPIVWLVRIAPVALLLALFAAIFVGTAFIGPGDSGPSPTAPVQLDQGPLALGDCVAVRQGALEPSSCPAASGRIVGYVPVGDVCPDPAALTISVAGYGLAACVA